MFWKKRKNKKSGSTDPNLLRSNEKAELIATMVHQLRSPVAAIRLTQQLLLENEEKNLNEKQLHLLRQTVLQADYMLDVINMLLLPDMLQKILGGTKTSSGSVELLLDGTIRANEIRIGEKEIKVIKKYDAKAIPVQFVNDQIQIVFSNVIDNAIKYTPKKGKITITTTYSNDSVKIDIGNTGQGISSEDVPNIFKKYRRTKNTEVEDRNGSGLGLYIAKQIMVKHGGSIEYSRNRQQESIFSIVIPSTV